MVSNHNTGFVASEKSQTITSLVIVVVAILLSIVINLLSSPFRGPVITVYSGDYAKRSCSFLLCPGVINDFEQSLSISLINTIIVTYSLAIQVIVLPYKCEELIDFGPQLNKKNRLKETVVVFQNVFPKMFQTMHVTLLVGPSLFVIQGLFKVFVFSDACKRVTTCDHSERY